MGNSFKSKYRNERNIPEYKICLTLFVYPFSLYITPETEINISARLPIIFSAKNILQKIMRDKP